MGLFKKNTDAIDSVKAKKEKKLTPEQQAINASEEFMNLMQGFESYRMQENEKSKKNAWRIAGASSVIAGLAVASIAFLTPLKTVEPLILRVDNNTGYVDMVTTLSNSQVAYGEEVAKYFLSEYVKNRESYDWYTIDDTFQKALLMSSEDEQNRLKIAFQKPTAPYKVYKDKERVKVEINNVSFIDGATADGGKAQVRYTQTIEPNSGGSYDPLSNQISPVPKVTKFVATIAYEYRNIPTKENVRLVNPVGFTVLSYRTDIEVVN